MGVRLEINPSKVMRSKFDPRYQAAQKFLDSEILRCSSPYVPRRDGYLEGSGIKGTKIGSGEVKWNIVYAKYQYYGLSFHHSTDRHPLASAQWFEKAKAVHRADWISGVEKIIKGG